MQRLAALLLIRQGEGQRATFFMLFFLLMGAGLAVGKGSADALFIKRYGVEYFPVVYMFLSVHLAAVCLLYAAYVDRLPSEKFFRFIFIAQLVVLAAITLVINLYDYDLVYPLYYIVYAISSELLIVHGALYIGQNYDTLQAKRLTPLIFAGYQTGMIIGGLVLIFFVPAIGLNFAPVVWALLVVSALLMLQLWHVSKGASPFYFHLGKSSKSRMCLAIDEIKEGFEFTRKTALLKNASWALFFMVITFYMLSYSAHTIYTKTFDNEAELTSFFGILVVSTNVLAMLIQVLVSNRIVDRFGIRKANYIYPTTTVLSFAFLLFHPGFYAALFASFNRETIMPAIRTPTRQLFFNILPDHIKGRARAISVAIVMPVALFVCGGMILLVKHVEGITPVAITGLVLGMLYLWYAVKMGQTYIATLLKSMREKLYLPDDEQIAFGDSGGEVLQTMQQGLDSDITEVSLCYAKSMLKAYPDEAVALILERVKSIDIKTADQMIKLIGSTAGQYHIDELEAAMQSCDDHLRATIFELLIRSSEANRREIIASGLHSENPRKQVKAIAAVFSFSEETLRQDALAIWHGMLESDSRKQYAAMHLLSVMADDETVTIGREELTSLKQKYLTVIPTLLQTTDVQRRISLIHSLKHCRSMLPETIAETLLQDIDHDLPAMRAAIASILHLLLDEDALEERLWQVLADGHPDVRQAGLCVLLGEDENVDSLYRDWLLVNDRGTPRAHKVLLEKLITGTASYSMLDEIIRVKADYSAVLLCAIDTLKKIDRTPALELMLIALSERQSQVNDLILMALQPLIDAETLQIIRAGLNSRDERHIANAIEALAGFDNEATMQLVTHLVNGECIKVVKQGVGHRFADKTEVLEWCASTHDWWLKLCGRHALMTEQDASRA